MKSYQDFRPMLRRTVRKSQGTMVAWDDLDDRLRPMVVAWDDHNDRLRRIVVAWDMMVAWDATGDIPFWGCLVSGDVSYFSESCATTACTTWLEFMFGTTRI